MCRFKKATCNSCSQVGHISRVCKNKVNFVDSSDDAVCKSNVQNEMTDIILYSGSNRSLSHIKKNLTVSDSSNSREVEFVIDTGSPHSFISIDEIYCLNSPIRPSSRLVRGITGHEFRTYGEIELEIEQSHTVKFFICDDKNIIGLSDTLHLYPEIEETLLSNSKPTPVSSDGHDDSVNALDSISNIDSVSTLIESVSNNSGGLKVAPIHIDCDSKEPIFMKSRSLPYGLRDPVKQTLDKLEQNGIIEKVSSSRWATPIVCPLKANGTVRICGDYKVTVNPHLRQRACTTLEPEDIFMKLANSKVFSRIDLENAFLQLPLDQESRELSTMNTPFGLYSYKFLPFGLKISPSAFQETIDMIISGIDNVVAYQDDVVIYSKDRESHMHTLTAVLNRFHEFNVRINKTKSVFAVEQIKYLGFVLSKEGIQPDADKFMPIMKSPDPVSVTELLSVLGSLQYYSRFHASFAETAAPLFDLCKSGQDFHWTAEHSRSLKSLKELVFSGKLQPFRKGVDTKVICDASEYAIGGMLEQEGQPIICVSRKLNKSERGYSQTQKEALALVWCVKRLHKFLYGLHFCIVTDHQSLSYIFHPHKSLQKGTSNMIQRWATNISQYSYDIEFRNGTKIPQADFLSRYSYFSDDDESEVQTSLFVQPLPVDANTLVTETKRYYSNVLYALRQGWSCRAKKLFHNLYVHRDELSITPEGILCFREMVVVPPALRKEMLAHLHSTHMSSGHMRSLSRLTCWWPTINVDIDNFVKSCNNCKDKKKAKTSSFKSWPLTYEKMQRIHADYAGPIKGYYFLVVVDSYSRWPEVFITKEATSEFTERCLRSMFAREGVPQVLVTDNGTHFAGNLKKWLQSIHVTHLHTAPRHPQSNGLAESFVKSLKYAISAVIKDISSLVELEEFVNNFLFQYRNCEHNTTKQRPSILFRGHALRSQAIGCSKVTFRKGNDLRLSNGIVLRNLGNRMVLIMDAEDGSTHRRHVEQLAFVEHPYTSPGVNDRDFKPEFTEPPPTEQSNQAVRDDSRSTHDDSGSVRGDSRSAQEDSGSVRGDSRSAQEDSRSASSTEVNRREVEGRRPKVEGNRGRNASEGLNVNPSPNVPPTVTRSGRQVKRPERLDW